MTDVWQNEPEEWIEEDGTLKFMPAHGVDLWCNTMEPGTVRDNLHVLGRPMRGDFTMQARLGGNFQHQYDQVGLLVRQDQDNWLKCGVETIIGSWDGRFEYPTPSLLINGAYTRGGWSEWSVVPPPSDPFSECWIRIEREKETFIVSFSLDGSTFQLMKVCAFPDADELFVGRFGGAPIEAGFTARISDFQLTTT